ncbi:MAG: Lin0512 family protein [Dehalococcoidales bacterium]|nr:MAG: Lin0512 family protein [Dehalococcoidales bacterium]
MMNKKRFVIEMGTGVEQHGQDITRAATKAVKDAISRVSLVGLLEIVTLEDLNEMFVEVLIACPRPDEVDADQVLQVLPFGQKEIKVVEGGMIVHGHQLPALEDKSDEIIIANAAVTVYIDTDKAVMVS